MFTQSVKAEHKSMYASPLAEEIVVSFEETILSGGAKPTSSTLDGRFSGYSGSAGGPDPDDPGSFDGGTIDL